MQVRWNGKLSQAFGVRNGVRQGIVLSPSLFNVYVDDLLKVLSVSGYGARIADMYCGCVAYADDLTLVSPTVNGMQKLLDICGSVAVSLPPERLLLILNLSLMEKALLTWRL